eukprot:TRINITY_DN7025_c1_g1_i1.p1 TRINITY_DN7025_c1_g1~~TRINITY_DN7025_c1_g1_i1.p1  ORF type:complete len:798 (+),score=227.94 TRINITY_DN7025_c1_g1_i1:99-2492(+)
MAESRYEPPAPMTAAQREMIERENHYRQLFAENPNSSEIQDPHLMLINVFDHSNEFNYQDESDDERRVPKLLTQNRKLGLQGPAVVDKTEFKKRWDEFTLGILNGLDWSNVFCAGGAVLGNLAKDNAGFNSSDIDLFIFGINDDEEANRKLKQIHQVVCNNTRGRGDVIRTQRAITILNSYPYRHVQIILRMYKSPAEVLFGFDIDSCTVGYDGNNVWCMPRFQRALTKRYNLVNNSRRSLTYEQRLYKYSKRGFAVAVPGLDKSRVDPSIFTKRVRDVTGLAKLLLLDYTAQRQATGQPAGGSFGGLGGFGGPKRRGGAGTTDGEQASDYNGDLDIPWGPGMQADQILRVLNVKDKKQFFAKLNRNKKAGNEGSSGTPSARPAHLFEKIFLDQPAGSLGAPAQKPIEWIKNNPAYQDYDNGFQRQLMTGSFHPVVGANWEEGAYGNGTSLGVGVLSSTAGRPAGAPEPAPMTTGASFSTASFGKAPRPVKKVADSDSDEDDAPAFKAAKFVAKAPKGKLPKIEKKEVKKYDPDNDEPKEPKKAVKSMPSSSFGSMASGGSFGAATPSTSSFAAALSAAPSAVAASYYAAVGGSAEEAPSPKKASPVKTTAPASYSPAPTPSSASYGGGGILMAPTASLSAFGPQPGAGVSLLDNQPGGALAGTPIGGTSRSRTSEFGSQSVSSFGGHGYDVADTLARPSTQQPSQPMQTLQMPQFVSQPAVALQPRDDVEAKPTTKILLLLALLYKQGRLTADERGKLKDMVITRNEAVFAGLEVFELDQDLDELVDTLKRICRLL